MRHIQTETQKMDMTENVAVNDYLIITVKLAELNS